MTSRSCFPEKKDFERHEGFLADKEAAVARGPVDLLWIGDSITDGWREEPQFSVFSERWGRHNPYNIGLSGDETQHVIWRLQNGAIDGISPKLAVVMIGTNNIGNSNQMTAKETATGIRSVVAELRQRLPQTKILVLGVFPRGEYRDDEYRGIIRKINGEIADLDDGRLVHFLDIGGEFVNDDGSISPDVMPDMLHLSELGYRIWADAVGPKIAELLGK